MDKKSLLAFIFDGLYKIRKCLLDNIVYYSFIAYGFEDVPFRSIDERSYYNAEGKKQCQELDISQLWDLDPLLKIAELDYGTCRERYDALKEKCKEIRFFCMLIIALIGFLLPNVLNNCNPSCWVWVPLMISGIFLGLAVIVLLVFWDKISWSVVKLDKKVLGHQGNDLKIFLIKEYHLAAFDNDLRLNYLADVIRVARFYFMFAFTALAVAFLLQIFLI